MDKGLGFRFLVWIDKPYPQMLILAMLLAFNGYHAVCSYGILANEDEFIGLIPAIIACACLELGIFYATRNKNIFFVAAGAIVAAFFNLLHLSHELQMPPTETNKAIIFWGEIVGRFIMAISFAAMPVFFSEYLNKAISTSLDSLVQDNDSLVQDLYGKIEAFEKRVQELNAKVQEKEDVVRILTVEKDAITAIADKLKIDVQALNNEVQRLKSACTDNVQTYNTDVQELNGLARILDVPAFIKKIFDKCRSLELQTKPEDRTAKHEKKLQDFLESNPIIYTNIQ